MLFFKVCTTFFSSIKQGPVDWSEMSNMKDWNDSKQLSSDILGRLDWAHPKSCLPYFSYRWASSLKNIYFLSFLLGKGGDPGQSGGGNEPQRWPGCLLWVPLPWQHKVLLWTHPEQNAFLAGSSAMTCPRHGDFLAQIWGSPTSHLAKLQ